jgi:cell division protein FtsL
VNGKRRVQQAKRRHPAQPTRPGARKPMSPRVRRRRAMLGTVLLGLFVVGFLFAFVYPTSTFLNQRSEISAAERRLQELDRQTAKLQRENKKLTGDAEIERVAREQYGMARPGETPYVLVPAAPTTTTTTTPPSSEPTQP